MERLKVSEETTPAGIITIYLDDDAESPREWDNIGTMLCWHRRYDLGDEQPKSSPSETLAALAYDLSPNPPEDDRIWEDHPEHVHRCLEKHSVMLPLYLYDHSGITMSCSSFSCPWDSGQVGFIYTTREQVIKEFGAWNEETIAQAENTLRGEVETYDTFSRGEIYCWEARTPEGEVLDACAGYYTEEEALDDARRSLGKFPDEIVAA
jgi:hypothetical protein